MMDNRMQNVWPSREWAQRGFAATAALTVGLFAATLVYAKPTLYEDGGIKVELSGKVAGFGVWADGAGADLSKDDGSGSSTASEFIFEPQLDLTWDTGNGTVYSRISYGFGQMHGEYDHLGWYFGAGDSGISSRREWMNIGYRNDVFDISTGSQDIYIGTGLLVGDGYSQNGAYGGNYFYGVQKAFSDTALLRINNIGNSGFRTDIFWLSADDNSPTDVFGNYKGESTDAAAINVEYDASRLSGLSAGTFAVMYLEILDAQDNGNPNLGKELFRDGREYYDLRADGIVFEGAPNWTFSAEVAIQDGSERKPAGLIGQASRGCGAAHNSCDFNAHVWYAVADYKFANVKWTPKIGYRYYQASGDDDPTDGKIEQHEALFFTGTAGWETWFQGQIWGEWLGSQENQNTHLVRASIYPADTYWFTVHYVRNEVNEDGGAAGYSDGDSYLDEINLFAEYYPGNGFYVAGVLSYGWVGDEDAFRGATGFGDDENLKSAFIWIQHSF